MTARCATTCRVLHTRADITPTGNVSACKFFSEFSVGNLQRSLAQYAVAVRDDTIGSVRLSASNSRRRARSATSSICTRIRRRCISDCVQGPGTAVRAPPRHRFGKLRRTSVIWCRTGDVMENELLLESFAGNRGLGLLPTY